MELEKRGVRTLTICTDVFQEMAELEKRAGGMPDLGIAIIEHPLVYRTDEELDELAAGLLPLLEARFGRGDESA
jgi:hypothetical protein